MKILFLGDPNPEGQDQLCDGLLHGFTRVYGQANVYDYFRFARHRADGAYLQQWPIWTGALAYRIPDYQEQLTTIADFDAHIVSLRALGLYRSLPGAFESALILIDPEDSPSPRPMIPATPRLVVHRPGCEMWGMPCHEIFISVPQEWMEAMLARTPYPKESGSLFAAMSDNGPARRAVMGKLAKEGFGGLHWGSGVGYEIAGTAGSIGAGHCLRAIEAARVVVNCRGAGRDTMMVSQALALGKCLVTDDFGGGDEYKDEIHCLFYRTPTECVERTLWALENTGRAANIAVAGHRLWSTRHTVEARALEIMKKAGIP